MEDEAIDLPIDGTLDLHTFRPQEVKSLVHDYLEACRDSGITHLRIVHGKGTGTLREIVHSQLRASPLVAHFSLADPSRGGWGATLVRLHAS